MALLKTQPIGRCGMCRHRSSYRRVLGAVLCAPCGRWLKRKADAGTLHTITAEWWTARQGADR